MAAINEFDLNGTASNTLQNFADTASCTLEPITYVFVEVYQCSIWIHTFWKGSRKYIQLWEAWSDGLQYLLWEGWHYGYMKMERIVHSKLHTLKMYLSGFRYSSNRGRHWDRKRRTK